MWTLLTILACAPASRRISAPPVVAPPTSELPAPARSAWLIAAVQQERGDLAGAVGNLARARAFDPSSPWLRLEQAEIALSVGDLASADVLLAEVEASHPEIVELWVLCGGVQLKRGELAGARASANRALSLAPARAAARELDLRVAQREGPDALARAVAAWRELPLSRPDELAARGLALSPYDASAAVDDLGAAFALGSADDAVVVGLAGAGIQARRLLSAMRWLERRPEAEGQAVATARARLGRAAGEPELELRGLRELYAQASSEDPTGPNATELLARSVLARYRLGEPTAALKTPAEAVFQGRANVEASLVFNALLAAGLLDRAAALVAELHSSGRADPVLEARLAGRQGRSSPRGSPIEVELGRLNAMNTPPAPGQLIPLVLAQSELEPGGAALSRLAQLVAEAEDPALQPALLLALARAYEGVGKADLAAATWEALLRLDPHHPAALLASARTIARSPAGPARALPRLEESLDGAPGVPEAWALYAELLEATGSPEEAACARAQSTRLARLRRLP